MTLSTNSPDHPVVLVVKSDLCNTERCDALRTASSACEVRVASATDLPAALEAVAPSCLVCDLQLCQFANETQPVIGTDVSCPVICITNSPQLSHVVHAIQMGVFDVFVTPVDQGALATAIERALEAAKIELEKLQRRNTIAECVETLTNREREVMSLLIEGLSLKQIASRLDVRFQTAAKHRARVLRKMGVANDVQLTLRILPTQNPDVNGHVCRVSRQGDLVWC